LSSMPMLAQTSQWWRETIAGMERPRKLIGERQRGKLGFPFQRLRSRWPSGSGRTCVQNQYFAP
jgi:hypothetical protein